MGNSVASAVSGDQEKCIQEVLVLLLVDERHSHCHELEAVLSATDNLTAR
jgi:hypothetical protein